MSFEHQLAARHLLYAPSQKLNSTYNSICYTSCEALGETKNSSMVHQVESTRRPIAPSAKAVYQYKSRYIPEIDAIQP